MGTGQTGLPNLARHASNDAVQLMEVLFGVTMTVNFLKMFIFPSKLPKFLIGSSESRKTQERFRAYIHEGSIDKHRIYLKLRGLRSERLPLTKT
jgi:hypothetical protein